MDLKHKVRTYNFWISLSAAILIVLRLVGESLGFVVDSVLFMDIATAVCGVLVVLGIIIMPTTDTEKTKKQKKAIDDSLQKEEAVCETEEAVQESACETDSAEAAQEAAQEAEAEQQDIEKEEEVAVKVAIEELAKNPTELYELVKLLLKNK